ncbi:MAG: hypothetical protein ACTSRP_14560 [Candidatus Helarchaeota archaeon]
MKSKLKFLIQITIALILTIIMYFLYPFIGPLPEYIRHHLEGGEIFQNYNLIFSLSIWNFSLSLAWLFYRDNPVLNNFLSLTFIPSGILVFVEIIYLNIFYDYIYIVPTIIGIIILAKKRNSLKLKYLLSISGGLIGLVYLEYFLGIAYSNISPLLLLLASIIMIYIFLEISVLYKWMKKLLSRKKAIIKRLLLGVIIFLLVFGIFLEGVLMEWYLRPSNYYINSNLEIESWTAISNGMHNSNTDMIYWNNYIYLVHDQRIYHFWIGDDAKLIVWRSKDAKNWEKVVELRSPSTDIRDPKFCNINGTLFLYALLNVGLIARPYQTVYFKTNDGLNWEDCKKLNLSGWLLWRPKTIDNKTWYSCAYWYEHGESVLLKTSNGTDWIIVSTIFKGQANDETALEFYNNDSIICTLRIEGESDSMFGTNTACTIIATSIPPYINWNYSKSYITRLDGPCLFSYNNKTFAIGRYQVGPKTIFTELGSAFSKKRTSIFLVEPDNLTYLTDLPSTGDTSYAGIVILGNQLYVSYYTSDIRFDYPWILGMVSKSDIRIARINLTSLINFIL